MNARTSLVRPFFPADVGQKTDKRVIHHPRATVIARSLRPRCNFRGRMVTKREFAPHPSFRVIRVEAGLRDVELYDFERVKLKFFDIFSYIYGIRSIYHDLKFVVVIIITRSISFYGMMQHFCIIFQNLS